MSMLHIENLQVYYGAINAIKGISFEVEQGEIIALIGPPGTGKTTLAKIIANTTKSKFRQINATTAGIKDIKETVEDAKAELGMYGKKTILESFRSKRDDLENEMQLKYNVYSTMSTQYQDAKARVQERTPAFTILKGASVPIKPTGPKRMLFVLAMTLLAFFVLTLWSVREYLLKD